jgi:hypothetical protein
MRERVCATPDCVYLSQIVTQIQSDDLRPDSPVRVLHAQPGSQVSVSEDASGYLGDSRRGSADAQHYVKFIGLPRGA